MPVVRRFTSLLSLKHLALHEKWQENKGSGKMFQKWKERAKDKTPSYPSDHMIQIQHQHRLIDSIALCSNSSSFQKSWLNGGSFLTSSRRSRGSLTWRFWIRSWSWNSSRYVSRESKADPSLVFLTPSPDVLMASWHEVPHILWRQYSASYCRTMSLQESLAAMGVGAVDDKENWFTGEKLGLSG